MAYDGPTISVKEFRELGLVQEMNRRFLHPLGLAMEVTIDDKTGEETIVRFWDNREDPEGWNYGPDTIDTNKARTIFDEEARRLDHRERTLGYGIQPLPAPKEVAVRELGVGETFAWRDTVWKVIERRTGSTIARGEQFSNIQEFTEKVQSGVPSWWTVVRRIP